VKDKVHFSCESGRKPDKALRKTLGKEVSEELYQTLKTYRLIILSSMSGVKKWIESIIHQFQQFLCSENYTGKLLLTP
jgi:hypothetical protein